MSTTIHFVHVGQGNMTLLQLDDGKVFMYDCNVTGDKEDAVLGYVAKQIGWGTSIHVFICSHRDADHMRGVKKVHKSFSNPAYLGHGRAGTMQDSSEYDDYMDLRGRSKPAGVGITEARVFT